MAVVSMQKIAVIAHKSHEDALLDLLHKEGVLEISNIPESVNVDHTEFNFRSAELDFAIQRLTPYADRKTQAALQKKPTEQQVIHAALHTDVAEVIAQVHNLETHDQEIAKRVASMRSDSSGSGDTQAAYFTSSSVQDETNKIGAGAVTEAAEKMKLEQAQAKKEAESNDLKRTELARELPNLVLTRQYIRWIHDKQAVREAMRRTRSTVILLGWLPKENLSHLDASLHKSVPASALLKVKADEGEEPPVLLDNPTALKPFESVTTLYGLPQANEIDPTPILSFFFILFFGLCLTDAGYGLVLAILMAAFIWKKKLNIEEGRLWWLLMFSGIVTFFVSIPFGGWFGLLPEHIQGFMPWAVRDMNGDGTADLFVGQIWNLGETKGITFFQNLSIALGILHLSVGIFLAGWAKWRVGQKAAAFWVDWTVLIMFAVAIAYFFVPAEMKQITLYALYASLAVLIWGKGYGSTWYLRPLFGLLGLANLAMGMLSNTLSYLRLLALGLVTGALALAVNLVAQQMGSLLPIYLAIPLMIVVYFIGHLVNIALNTLGAFIHSGRLQFVEFFGQFFEGGGRPYQPFKRSVNHAS